MKNLIVVFNRIESHDNFMSINVKDLMYVFNNATLKLDGFSELGDHFIRLLPSKPIIGNTFSINSDGFIDGVSHSEILLIHLKNNINDWNDSFKEQFSNYANQFDKVLISYHMGVNGEDVKIGNHEAIKSIISSEKSSKIKSTKKFHHTYQWKKEEQLYGFLAKAIVNNQGIFNPETYNTAIEKLISFFQPDEEILALKVLNQKLTFLHKLLGGNFDKEVAEKFEIREDHFDKTDINKSFETLANKLLN